MSNNKGEDKYLSKVAKLPFARVFAWIGIIVIVALVIATFITGITGSKYFLGMLVVTMIVPFLMYIVLWIGRVLSNDDDNKPSQAEEDQLK